MGPYTYANSADVGGTDAVEASKMKLPVELVECTRRVCPLTALAVYHGQLLVDVSKQSTPHKYFLCVVNSPHNVVNYPL